MGLTPSGPRHGVGRTPYACYIIAQEMKLCKHEHLQRDHGPSGIPHVATFIKKQLVGQPPSLTSVQTICACPRSPGSLGTEMTNRFKGFMVLVFLMAASLAVHSYVHLSDHAKVVVVAADQSLLALECDTPFLSASLPGTRSSCNRIDGDIHFNLGIAGWRGAGHIVPSGSGVGPQKTRAYDETYTLQVRNQSNQALRIDVNVSEGWPRWAGICTLGEDTSGEYWFIKPGSSDTGYTRRLEPLSTMKLSLQFEAPFPAGSGVFAPNQIPVIDIEATVIP
jgi:hypothetical protein